MSLPYPSIPPADFGFGTAYERLAIYDRLRGWMEDWAPACGMEGFWDGFTGLPGLHLLPLAERGGRVTVACQPDQEQTLRTIYRQAGCESRLDIVPSQNPDDFPQAAFDVVMLFNPFPYVTHWRDFLGSAARLSRERLIVSVANPGSYGALFRRILKKIRPTDRTDLFDHPATDPRVLRRELEKYGHIEIEDGWDCPWWPDLFVEAGDSLASWLLSQLPGGGRLARRARGGSQTPSHLYGADLYPYASPDSAELALLRKKAARHPTFDHRPNGPLKRLFAHHRVYVVRCSLRTREFASPLSGVSG